MLRYKFSFNFFFSKAPYIDRSFFLGVLDKDLIYEKTKGKFPGEHRVV